MSASIFAFVLFILGGITYWFYLSGISSRLKGKQKKQRIWIWLPALSFLVSTAYFLVSGLNPAYAIILGFGSMFGGFLGSYSFREYHTYASIFFLSAIMLFLLTVSGMPAHLLVALGIGIMPALVYFGKSGNLENETKRDAKQVEVRRDIIQIAMGLVTIAIVAYIGAYVQYLFWISMLIFLGIISTARYPSNGISKAFMSIEKPYARYGNGGLLLISGSLLIAGFVRQPSYLLFFLSLILLADPIATIVGINIGGPKLPYQKKKSVSGTIAFFLFGCIIGYFLVGLYAIPLSLIIGIAESSSGVLDDNVLISVLSMALYYLITSL